MPTSSDHPYLEKIINWARAHPALVLGAVRLIDPILDIKNLTVVTRFDDVQEVLSRDEIFHATYQEKMEKVTGGENFFLGMHPSARYTRDVSNMRITIRREDLDTIVVPQVEAHIARCMESVLPKGRFDIVQELTRIVPTELVGSYFGTPGWQRDEFTDAASRLFAYLFYPDNPEQEPHALAAAKQTCDYLDATIAARKLQDQKIDDVLGRCLSMQAAHLPGFSDLEIRNNLIGMIIGAIPTTSKAATLTIDYLLSHPELLADAQAAALDDDNYLMNQYVLESLRFNPFGPGVFRVCAQDYVLGQGSLRSTTIPKGRLVVAVTQAAMLDGDKVEDPHDFVLDRPNHVYMHYGYGMHTCFGQYINSVQIARIVKAILKLPGLRRADGEAGVMKVEHDFPAHLMVEFDTH